MKKLLFMLLFIMGSSVQAEKLYSNVGLVSKSSINSTVISIDNIDYTIDTATVIQQGFVSEGEIGPEIYVGSLIGFNIDDSVSPPRLTDVWLLDDQ